MVKMADDRQRGRARTQVICLLEEEEDGVTEKCEEAEENEDGAVLKVNNHCCHCLSERRMQGIQGNI